MTTGVFLMAHGTPATAGEIAPFYTRIRRGRPPTLEQLADLEARYAAIGGVSPLALRTAAQVDAVRAELEARVERELRDRTFRYTRTDGSTWSLSLRDVVDRATALETAYNPNDCVEARWGAPEGSEEGATCHAHAPVEQTAKMQDYRSWFHERRRPPR